MGGRLSKLPRPAQSRGPLKNDTSKHPSATNEVNADWARKAAAEEAEIQSNFHMTSSNSTNLIEHIKSIADQFVVNTRYFKVDKNSPAYDTQRTREKLTTEEALENRLDVDQLTEFIVRAQEDKSYFKEAYRDKLSEEAKKNIMENLNLYEIVGSKMETSSVGHNSNQTSEKILYGSWRGSTANMRSSKDPQELLKARKQILKEKRNTVKSDREF